MIVGFDDPLLGSGAPLGQLASGRHRLRLPPHEPWLRAAPAAAAAGAAALLAAGLGAAAEARVYLVPGRLEVLGKHTDYAGGRSLLAAVERGFTFVAAPRRDARVRVIALDTGEENEFPLSPDLEPEPGWANYPMTAARRLARDFPGIGPGMDVAIRSDLPPAAGMSSSSALLIGTVLSLAGATGLFEAPRFRGAIGNLDALASYLAAVESGQGFGALAADRGVGTHGGSEDHTAILQAQAAALLQYSFIPPVLERTVPMPEGYRFVLAASGVQAEKTGAMRARYNRASALARALLDLHNQASHDGATSLAAALRQGAGAAERLRQLVTSAARTPFPRRDLLDRLEHFLQESETIVPAAAGALAEGDLEAFGALVDRSQSLAERLLGTQIPETVELSRSARRLGAVAASAFGAGYGGSVWALVEARHGEEFLARWRAAYEKRFPGSAPAAAFFASAAGPAARRVA